jgi:proteasome alpha subunit
VVMGGTTEPITTALKDSYTENADLTDAVRTAVAALRAGSANGSGADQPALGVSNLEVAILDAGRPRRAFRRFSGAALETLLQKAGSKGSKGAKASKDAKESKPNGESPDSAEDSGEPGD